jgi:hypothetical protein
MDDSSDVRAFNLYYARHPEERARVLATRLRASRVRESIGLPHGRVFLRVGGPLDSPDVMWDCPFIGVPGHDRDMEARAASTEFEAVRTHMRTLTRRFERVLYAIPSTGRDTSDWARVGAPLAQWWKECPDPGPTDGAPALSSFVTVLRRLDANERLPHWILETGIDHATELAEWAGDATESDPAPMILTWERVA